MEYIIYIPPGVANTVRTYEIVLSLVLGKPMTIRPSAGATVLVGVRTTTAKANNAIVVTRRKKGNH